MTLLKYAYLLDQDNYCVENKVFIDLMWNIAKEKMVSEDKNGKKVMKAKSYVIRNAAIMFQQIFYWHFNAIKNGKNTKYQYKEQNVVKMDFEDWWDSIRITDTEVTTANKLLIETGLVKIVKMRIKVRDKEIYKPSNCYIINTTVLEQYLNNIIEISKEIYADKVHKVREDNVKTSMEYTARKKQSTDLSTNNNVTLVTQETLNLNELDSDINSLCTLSTSDKPESDSVLAPVTPVTDVTVVPPVTDVTVVPPVTDVTYISNTSCSNTSSTKNSEEGTPSLSVSLTWEDIKENLKNKMTNISFNTWFIQSIADVSINKNIVHIYATAEFSAEILRNRYMTLLQDAVKELSNDDYKIDIDCVMR